MKNFTIWAILALSSLWMTASVSNAQTSRAYRLWQMPSHFRGFVIATDNLSGDQEFINLKDSGATLAVVTVGGFRAIDSPYAIDSSIIALTDEMINGCRRAGLPYTLSVRQGPGRQDSYIENSGGTPISTIWTNSSEQKEYASMLREITERYCQDTLCVGITPIEEPDPLFNQLYIDTGSLDRLLVSNHINLQSIFETCLDSIRSASPDIPILIEGSAFAAPEFIPLVPRLSDPYIVYEFHSYRPTEFVYATDTSTLPWPGTYFSYMKLDYGFFDKAYLSDTDYMYVDQLQEVMGAPIFLGEFGIEAPHGNGAQFLSDVSSIALDRGWSFAYWIWHGLHGYDYEQMPAPFWQAVHNSLIQPAESVSTPSDISGERQPQIFFDPSHSRIEITAPIGPKEIMLSDILGRVLQQMMATSGSLQLPTGNLSQGEYVVQIRESDGESISQLILIP